MYNTENDFSKALTNKLNHYGMRVTRIETHSTVNGIPDMFIDGYGFDTFIELKNSKSISIHDKVIKVQWRPGQQAWMHEYFLKHKYFKCCLTIISCVDGWFVIPMTQIFKNSTIYNADCFGISYDELKHVNLARLLHLMSTRFKNSDTYRSAIIAMVNKFWHFNDNTIIDYDPDALWNEQTIDDMFDACVFESAKLGMFCTLEGTMRNVN